MNDQLYFEVSGTASTRRYVIVFPAQDEEEAVRLFAKLRPHVQYITGVRKSSKVEYETQENNKLKAAQRKENETRWNRILKQEKVENAN